ncbi:MAG: DUF211 domain-containing protein [Candidatus Bathyarchaeia archaeon]
MDDNLVEPPTIKKVVLDVLKPHQPAIPEFASRIVSCNGANRVNVSLAEIDQNTESIKVLVEGNDINLETIRTCIEEMGATIHSVDEVEVARKV